MHRTYAAIFVRLLVLAVTLSTLTGCPPTSPRPGADLAAPAQPPAPTYAEIAQRYNANIARIDRLRSTAEIDLKWYEGEGDRREKHFHSGEGHVILRLPDCVALDVGKLGQIGLWAGCNATHYWLFDLQEEPKTVYFGRYESAGAADLLAAPIRPRDLPMLLGLQPLPIDDPKSNATVVWDGAELAVRPPDGRTRLILNPHTAMAIRIELLDEDGQTSLIASLSLPSRVRLRGSDLPSRDWPQIATHIQIHLVAADATMRIRLQDLSAGPDEDRIKPKLFDLDYLADEHFKIDAANRIDLDQ